MLIVKETVGSHEVFTEIHLVLCGFQIACCTPVIRACMKVRGFE